ncbi:EF-hand domain-containing protein [Emcibacter sp.]|uniref:EF-hand domain-containing protein n=1 Tax=Emcibacter sp. TaxID=1979954 RepID=UPI003A912AF6
MRVLVIGSGGFRLSSVFFLFMAAVIVTSCAPKRAYGPGSGPGNKETMLEAMKERLDTDRDGRITCEDVKLKQDKLFAESDVNDDGFLDLEEFSQASWSHPAYARDHLALYDRSQDGLLSREEFETRRDDRFAGMDLDGDCIVTDKELGESLKARGGPGRQGGGRPPGGGTGHAPPGM